MFTGTLLQDKPITRPNAAIFFNRDPNKLIVACSDGIHIVDLGAQSTLLFRGTPQFAVYFPYALALSDDDTVLVAGCDYPCSVSGYDIASLERLWIRDTNGTVGAVCMLGAHVVATVWGDPTLILDHKNGELVATLQKADGQIFGLGVIEGLCFIPLNHSHTLRTPQLRVPCHAPASYLPAV